MLRRPQKSWAASLRQLITLIPPVNRAFLGGEAAFNPALIAVQKRAAAFTGLPWTHSECLQLVSYHAGQHFALHTDYFDEVSAVTFCASCLGRF